MDRVFNEAIASDLGIIFGPSKFRRWICGSLLDLETPLASASHQRTQKRSFHNSGNPRSRFFAGNGGMDYNGEIGNAGEVEKR